MEDKLKLVFNKLIYEYLNLGIIEKELCDLGIKSKEMVNNDNYDVVSKYFFLKNKIHLNRLNFDEINFLKFHLQNIDFSNIIISDELARFLLSRISKILLPETNQKYISYCGTGENFLAPSDAIVLGFQYLKYLNHDEKDNEKNEEILYDRLNYIQNELAASKNFKIAVLIFDELVNEKNIVR